MTNIYQAAQGIPGPHSYMTPGLQLAQTIPSRAEENEHTARPRHRIYPLIEAEYERLKEVNAARRRKQAERNFKAFGAGVWIVEAMEGNLENSARAFSPDDGEDGDGTHSGLAERAMNDWSWKPGRYKADPGVCYKPGYAVDRTASLEAQMPTFRGVPKGAAEMHRGQVFARS